MDEKHALAACVITISWDDRRKCWWVRTHMKGAAPVLMQADTSIDLDPVAMKMLTARIVAGLEELLPFLAKG
jgi:hypothetical protein